MCLVPCVGMKSGFIILFQSVCACRTFCVWIFHVLERKKASSLFSRSVCACRTFCVWICPVLERKEALSLFSGLVCVCRTFVPGYALCLKEKRLYHCFLNWSAHAGPFCAEVILFISLCMKDLLCLNMPHVGEKKGQYYFFID